MPNQILLGWLVLGGSPFTTSPFYGVIHNLEVYSDSLSNTDKFALNMQYLREYQLTAGTWQFWNYDSTYYASLNHILCIQTEFKN